MADRNIFVIKNHRKIIQKEKIAHGGSRVHVCKEKLLFITRPLVPIVRAGCLPDDRQMAPDPDLRRTIISGNPDACRLTKGGATVRASWAPDDRSITRLQIHGLYEYRKALRV